jgi:hypothetical protein
MFEMIPMQVEKQNFYSQLGQLRHELDQLPAAGQQLVEPPQLAKWRAALAAAEGQLTTLRTRANSLLLLPGSNSHFLYRC